MRIHFINVGYGEAILLIKDNFVILVDGGTNRPNEYLAPGTIRVEDYIKKLGYDKIDLLIITHLHDDHVSGLVNIIESLQVKKIWINVKPLKSTSDIVKRFSPVVAGNESGMLFINALSSYAKILDQCCKKNIPIEQIGKVNGKIKLEHDIVMDILSPTVSVQNEISNLFCELQEEQDLKKAECLFYKLDSLGNSSSLAFRVESGEVSALLTGDQTQGWDELYSEYGNSLESKILKVTHHGQIDGMPQAMLDISNPKYIVVCSSADRRFNSAHPSVIERAQEHLLYNHKKGGIYVTGLDGTIIFPPVLTQA